VSHYPPRLPPQPSSPLLWRGQGKSDVSTDPTTYDKDVARTVRDIVAKFPAASSSTVAAHD
jgi:hypothetical protein